MTISPEQKNKGAGNCRRPFGRRKGTLTLRSWLRSWFAPFGSRLCSQFTNGSRDISAVDFPVLNRHTRTRCQITRTLRFRIDCESDLLRLAANLLGNDQLIRIDRSDRTLGEMRRRLGCFRLGIGGRDRIRFRVLPAWSRSKKRHTQCGKQSESLKLKSHLNSFVPVIILR